MKRSTLIFLFSVFILLNFFTSFKLNAQNKEKETIVLVSTDLGNIKVKLYNKTPKHRDNFINLVKKGIYDSTLFHRVIASFMIQGGDPNSKNAKPGQALGNGEVGERIPAEFDSTLYHKRGVLAAARDGNPQKASSSCQFYIVQGRKFTEAELNNISLQTGKKFNKEKIKTYTTIGGTPHLDGDYTVFGEVIEGMDVVDKIATIQKDRNDRPLKDIRMKMVIVN